MADDGGSTGMLRDELGVLPPGDLRQCLIALSEADELVRELFTHRFSNGTLKGHNFGNLFISALEQVSGSIEKAVDGAADVLKIRGDVLPVTLNKTKLVMTLSDGTKLDGEWVVSDSKDISKKGVKSMRLTPKAELNPAVERAIRQADLIVVGPGNLYSSILPNFLVKGLHDALKRAYAPTVYIANLMNKEGQTEGYDCTYHVQELEKFARGRFVDIVLYNTGNISNKLIKRYEEEGMPVVCTPDETMKYIEYVGSDLVSESLFKRKKGDPIQRTLIRHDPDKLSSAIIELLQDTM
jgi:uncharacterized cofD-like protein